MIIALTLLIGSADAAKADKVDVCHHSDDGISIININGNALDAHVDNHGDWAVEEEVCGDGIDNDCDGEVDEDCCPCSDLWPSDLSAYDQNYCYSDVSDDPYFSDLSLFDSYNTTTGDYVYGYSVDWGPAYEAGGFPDASCYSYSDADGDTQIAITAEEHLQCAAQIDAMTAATGAVCYSN